MSIHFPKLNLEWMMEWLENNTVSLDKKVGKVAFIVQFPSASKLCSSTFFHCTRKSCSYCALTLLGSPQPGRVVAGSESRGGVHDHRYGCQPCGSRAALHLLHLSQKVRSPVSADGVAKQQLVFSSHHFGPNEYSFPFIIP